MPSQSIVIEFLLKFLEINVVRHGAVIIALVLLLIALKIFFLKMSLLVDHVIVKQVVNGASLYLKLSDNFQLKVVDHLVDVLVKQLHLLGHLLVYVILYQFLVHVLVIFERIYTLHFVIDLVLNVAG